MKTSKNEESGFHDMEMAALRIGFVGLGEAAKAYAAAFRGRVAGQVAYCNGVRHRPPYASEFREEASKLDVVLVDTMAAVAQRADMVISAVATGAAVEVAAQIAPHLKPGQMYVDMNAAPPEQKETIAELVNARSATFVDAELMGAVSLYGHTVSIYVSGDGAEAFRAALSPLGLNITVVPGLASAAAFLKMLRSAVTKGMEALLVEAMFTAYRAGVPREAFLALTEPMDAVRFSDFAKMCLISDPIHSGRRAQEMMGVAQVIRRAGVVPIMAEATQRRLEWSAGLGVKNELRGQEAEDFLAVLALYDKSDRRRSSTPA